MKKFILLLFINSCFSQAPTVEWQKCLGGTSDDGGICIIETADGGYVFTGESSSYDGNVTINHGNIDVWVVKTNSVGEILWEKSFGGTDIDRCQYVQETSDGSLVMTGYTKSNNHDFTDNHGQYDFFVIKLDSNGNLVWKKCYGGTSIDYGYSIKQTYDGGFIVSGVTGSDNGDISSDIGLYDFWLFKIDSVGNIEWENVYGGIYDDLCYSVNQTSDNGFIISGYSDSIDGNAVGNHSDLYDCLVLKLDQLGNVQWQKMIGGTGEDYCFDIIETSDNGFVGVGFSSSINGDISTNNNGGFDGLVFKLNSDGYLNWINTFGGSLDDAFTDVKELDDGNIIISGLHNGFYSPNGNSQSWIVKISSSGNLIWDKKLGGTNNDRFNKSYITSSNSIISIGNTSSNNIDVSGNHGNNDFWVVKFLPESLSTITLEKSTIAIYPNPTSESINVELAENTIQKIKITDFLGKVIVEQIGNNNQINVENLSNGIYIIQVITEDNQYETKFIKQ